MEFVLTAGAAKQTNCYANLHCGIQARIAAAQTMKHPSEN